jgi:hypothetical protein
MLTFALSAKPVPLPSTGRKVNEWCDGCGQVMARAFRSGGLCWIDCQGVGVFGFSVSSREVRVWPSPDSEYQAIISTFSRLVEPLIMQEMGWQTLHAGAAFGSAGALAFCGRSGSGKSTLAFAMQDAGWRQLADDALVLRIDPDCIVACPLSFTPRLRSSSLAHFAPARGPLPFRSQSNAVEVPLTAVFLLRQEASLAGPRISLLSQARAFSELLCQAERFDAEDPTRTRQLLKSYLELAARVPVYTLEYRPSFQDIPQLTRAIMETASGTNLGAGSSQMRSEVRPS